MDWEILGSVRRGFEVFSRGEFDFEDAFVMRKSRGGESGSFYR